MEESRNVGRDRRYASNANETVADKIIRDAEAREGRSSDREGQPVHETTSSYLGMKRKEAPSNGDISSPAAASEKTVRGAEMLSTGSHPSEPVHEKSSSYLGMTRKEAPATVDKSSVAREEPRESYVSTGDNPAPFSSALGIPTLLKEDSSEPSSASKGDNPAPFSSALHIPTLINEPKPESDR